MSLEVNVTIIYAKYLTYSHAGAIQDTHQGRYCNQATWGLTLLHHNIITGIEDSTYLIASKDVWYC